MMAEGMNYPLHLGVTEAGDGEDGRIKSAVGIGTLLEDGLGDTIRVSLTEEPEEEAPVAIALANRYKNRSGHQEIPKTDNISYDPFSYLKIPSMPVNNFGDKNSPRVIADLSDSEIANETLADLGLTYLPALDKWNLGDQAPDYIFVGDQNVEVSLPESLDAIQNYNIWFKKRDNHKIHPIFTYDEYLNADKKSMHLNFVEINVDNVFSDKFGDLVEEKKVVFVFSPKLTTTNAFLRFVMGEFDVKTHRSYGGSLSSFESFLLAQYKAGHSPILLVDEAQNMTRDMLLLIQHLFNFSTNTNR
jgi:(E)-4-hydroxy-3-methylbut-2-enyl-diphosphate synthase